MKRQYYRTRLFNVPDSFEDLLTQMSFDHGSSGVSEVLDYEQRDLAYDPRIQNTDLHVMDVFFEKTPSPLYFEELQQLVPQLKWEVFTEEHKDWLEEWKKGFKAFRLVSQYWVVPSWLEVPAQAEKPIRIDPGMAFGTGTHATTQMMAQLIYQLTEKQPDLKDKPFLEIGIGTGILSILAHLQGVDSIQATEIDPEARRVAQENLLLNGCEKIEVLENQVENLHGSFAVIMANIVDGVLLQLKPDLLRLLQRDGHFLLSGLLLEREEEFLQKFLEGQKLQVVRRLEKDEWVALWLHREI